MHTCNACRVTMYPTCRTRTELLACACGDTMACLLRGGVRCKFDQMHIPATFLLDGGWVRSRNFRLKHSDPPYQPDTHQGAPRTSRSHCQHRGVNCWLRRAVYGRSSPVFTSLDGGGCLVPRARRSMRVDSKHASGERPFFRITSASVDVAWREREAR